MISTTVIRYYYSLLEKSNIITVRHDFILCYIQHCLVIGYSLTLFVFCTLALFVHFKLLHS